MRRKRTAVCAIAATAGLAGFGIAAPPAFADTYTTLQCVNTQITNVQICIERDDQNSNYLYGQMRNNSTSNIYNLGKFQYSGGTTALTCNNGNYSYTNAHTTSSCGASFKTGQQTVRVCDNYNYAGGNPQTCTGYWPSS